MIQFRKEIVKAKILDPRNNFSEKEIIIERRQDPLTKEWCRINIERAKRPKQAESKELKIEVKECPFCDFEKRTPKFPNNIIEGGRIVRDNAKLFPNLFPFAKYHAVCAIKHVFNLKEISYDDWINCFFASLEFVKKVYENDNSARFASINFNFMPPAAASILHPHLQITVDEKPSNAYLKIFSKLEEFYKNEKQNFFDELIYIEKKQNERFIYEKNDIAFLATFAPKRNHEILCICKASNFFELTEDDVKVIAKGIANVMYYYASIGINSCNFSMFSGDLKESKEYFAIITKICSRPSFKANYSSDIGFMELYHEEPVISTLPEDVAKDVKKFFQ